MSIKNKSYFGIYIHKFPNGKVYVGKFKDIPEKRWGHNGNNYKRQIVYNAIKKYGWNNIEHIIYKNRISEELAFKYEKYLIIKLKSNNSKYGYNLTNGGEGISGVIHTKNTKEKIRLSKLGKPTGMNGSKNGYAKEVVAYDIDSNKIEEFGSMLDASIYFKTSLNNISNSCTGRVKYYNNSYVFRYKGDAFEKYEIKFREIIQYDMNGNEIKRWKKSDFVKNKEISESQVIKCCDGKLLKYNFSIWRYAGEDFYKYKVSPDRKDKISVDQYTLDGKFIKNYCSSCSAGKIVKVHAFDILRCCRGELKTCGGYIWKLHDLNEVS